MEGNCASQAEPARRRRLAAAVLGFALPLLIIAAPVGTWITQIAFALYAAPAGRPVVDCRAEIAGLFTAVARAAERGRRVEIASERAALEAFHAGLAPEWHRRAALGARCAARHGTALQLADRLLAREEQALRSDSADLARLRRLAAAALAADSATRR